MEQIIVSGERTVLVVGPDIRQLERICSRMLLFNRGQILLDSDPASVCKIYFEEAERKIVAQTPPSASGPTHDVGVARLFGIELIGASAWAVGPEVPMNASVRIRATIHTNRAIQRPEIVIGAHTPDRNFVFSMSSALNSGRPDLPEGVSEIECAIPDMPLRPGQYSLRLAIFDQLRNVLWHSENLHPFRVVPGEADITRIPVLGLTHFKCEWTFGAAIEPTVQEQMSALTFLSSSSGFFGSLGVQTSFKPAIESGGDFMAVSVFCFFGYLRASREEISGFLQSPRIPESAEADGHSVHHCPEAIGA